PVAFACEVRPATASIVIDAKKIPHPSPLVHDPEKWEPVFRQDHAQTNEARATRDSASTNRALASQPNARDAPISIYEVHLGSWRRRPEDDNRWLSYRELAEVLPAYVADMGFTHVELLPVAEHPFD